MQYVRVPCIHAFRNRHRVWVSVSEGKSWIKRERERFLVMPIDCIWSMVCQVAHTSLKIRCLARDTSKVYLVNMEYCTMFGWNISGVWCWTSYYCVSERKQRAHQTELIDREMVSKWTGEQVNEPAQKNTHSHTDTSCLYKVSWMTVYLTSIAFVRSTSIDKFQCK